MVIRLVAPITRCMRPLRFSFSEAVRTLLLWQDRIRQRYQLAELDDRRLADIGLSRVDVEREVSKPFWSE
jgi:uncharacterized protein YjiS (DUF1127 family)